ncbi:hypothetical protein ACGFNU_34680 [Spirillospora sp. NPDC048911]|uniref:hypothetical protein n=1 Tax=Spirillospora sp. NPDC048911 TaxID=3364527 RepID=UPI00371107F6
MTVRARRIDLRGDVVLETTYLSGKPFGLLPLPLSADLPLPPVPVTLPVLTSTDVKARQVFVRSATAQAGDLRQATRP